MISLRTLGAALIASSCIMPAAPVFASSERRIGDWVYAEQADPMTDLVKGLAGLYSADGKSMLAFQCDNSVSNRPMFFGVKLGPAAPLPANPRVEVRVDAGQPKTFLATRAGDLALIADPSAVRSFASLLKGGSRLSVRINDIDFRNVDAQFAIVAAEEALSSSAHACGKDDRYVGRLFSEAK